MDGKFFIRDFALENASEDYFGHNDFARNVTNILETQSSPYNIAIIGKWGLGKSSLVNFVEQSICEKKDFEFISINAWKYEKEAFRKVFLKKTWEKLGGKEETVAQRLKRALNNYELTEENIPVPKDKTASVLSRIGKLIKPFIFFIIKILVVFLIVTILSIGYRFVGYLVTSGFNLSNISLATAQVDGAFSIYDQLVLSFSGANALWAAVIPFAIVLVQQFLGSYSQKTTKSYNILNPAKTTDDYENLLIEQLSKKENKNKTIVTLIDDLDRLNTEKVVDALDAIKSFSDIAQCVFIVPFDEDKIIEALEESKKCNNKEYGFVISELFLDKLFQFRIYLPGILKRDFIPYAKSVCSAECPELVKICDDIAAGCFSEEILPILIHYHIDTPRQIKKIINTFTNNLLVLKHRIAANKVNLTMSLITIRQIAKLSVLQSDFSSFYNYLFDNPSIINDIITIHEAHESEKNEQSDISEQSQEQYTNLKTKMKNISQLMDFLSNNRHIKLSAEEIRTLIYMSDSKSAMRAGGKEQALAQALSVGDGQSVRKVIEKFNDPCAYLVSELIEGQLSRPIERQYLVALYGAFEVLEQEKRDELATVISKKTEVAINTYSFVESESIDVSDILLVYEEAGDKQGVELLLNLKFENCDLSSTEEDTQEEVSNTINSIIGKHNILSDNIKNSFKKNIANNISDSKKAGYCPDILAEAADFDFNVQIYNEFFTVDFFKALVTIIFDENILSGRALDLLLQLVEIFKELDKTDELPDILYPVLQRSAYLKLLHSQIIDMKDSFGDSMPVLIEAIAQNEVTEDSAGMIVELLEALDWEVYEKIKGDIDACLAALNQKQYLNVILTNISNKNQLNLIPKTIAALNEEAISTDEYHELISTLIPNYSDDELEDLLSKLSANILHTANIEVLPNAISIFRFLESDERVSDRLLTMKTTATASFATQYAKYPEWAIRIVEIIGFKTADKAEDNNYLSLLNKLFVSNMALSLKGWRYVHGTVQTEILETMLNNIFSVDVESFADHFDDLYYFLSQWEQQILESPERTDYYEGILIRCLDIEDIVNNVLSSLGKFENISSLPSLYATVGKLNEEQREIALGLISKSINASSEKVDCIYNLLSDEDAIGDPQYISKLANKIFENPVNGCYKLLLERADENSSFRYLNNLLIVVAPSQNSINKGIILNVVKLICSKGGKVVGSDFTAALKQYKGFFISLPHQYELKASLEVLKPHFPRGEMDSLIAYLGLNSIKKPKKAKKKFF